MEMDETKCFANDFLPLRAYTEEEQHPNRLAAKPGARPAVKTGNPSLPTTGSIPRHFKTLHQGHPDHKLNFFRKNDKDR